MAAALVRSWVTKMERRAIRFGDNYLHDLKACTLLLLLLLLLARVSP
jgi:hypothetical protein